jgi:hypothetical protein
MRHLFIMILLTGTIVSHSPFAQGDRHCSQGLGWMTIILSRISAAEEPSLCATQRVELLEWVEEIKQDFRYCGCPNSESELDKLDWPKAETAQECTLTRSDFRDEISRIQSFANDECGH